MEPLQVSHSSKYKTISNPATVNQSENSVRVPEEAKRDTPSSSDNSEEAEGFLHIGSPIAVMWYDFLMHPRSSLYAMCWSIMLCSLVILRIIAILLESCNGPNQYYKRDRVRASYYFLLSEPEYFQMYVACFTPLLLDTAMRIVLVLLITFESENYPVYRRFVSDRTELVMFACDVICVIPFLVSAVHLAPRDFLSLSQAESITLSIMELLMTSRIFRLLRNIPAIRAVSIALTNSFEHLVLPIFFFFAFNITTGVFFYFAEPCYDLNVCPWTSLFQSSFYSIVTMTTTGYGNQVPSFILSRGVAVSVMLFGSLYLSMPLAIIGNEYDKAWNQVQEEEEILRQQRLAELTNDGAFNADKSDHSNANVTSPHGGSGGFSLTKMGAVDKKVTPLPSRASTPPTPRSPPGEMTSQPMQSPSRRMSAEEQAIIMSKTLLASSIEDKRQRVRMSSVMVIRHSLIDKLHHLHAQYKAHPRFIAPSVMIGLCELRAWLPTLVLGIEEVLRSVSIFETRLASQPSPSNLISAPAPSVPAPAPVAERRRYSVIGRGGAVINRSAPASTVVPQYTAPSTTLTATSANYTMIYSPHHPYSLPPTTSTSTYNKAAGVGVGVGSLPPLLEASRRNSKNTSNNNNNSINNRKNSNNNTDPYNNSSSTATTATTRRRSSNNNNYNSKTNNTSNSNNNVRKVKTSEDIDDSDDLGSLGSLGSFAFSSDEELEDNEDFDHVLQHLLSPPPLPPSSSLHMSSSVDSSSHSALSQAAHVTTNNAIVMSPPRPSMSLAMSQRESQIPEEKSGSDSEEEEEEEDSNDDDDVETGKRGHVRHNSNLSQQSNSSWKKRYVAVQPSPDVDHRDPRRSSETSQKSNGEKRKETVLSEAIFIEARQRARTSMYNRLVHMLKAKDPELRRRTLSEDAMERLKSVAQDPLRLRNRLWILLEFPHSSREARALQILLIFLICLSIFIMYTQTITSLTLYGESQPICGSLLELYCWDKDDASLDPGCFVQNMHGATSSKLQYNCDSGDCFGHGLNFGSGYTNMTCSNTSAPSPFQTTEQLQYSYGTPLFITSRNMMQRVSAICSRIECTDNSVGYYDASPLWIVTEFVMNAIFLVELVLRVLVAQSLRSYVKDIMNFFDCLAILPFLLTIFVLNGGSISSIDFSILASSPYNFTIVLSRAFLVFRLFKLTRHFRASKVLFETAKIVWRQILGMLALLALMVLLFSIILFELEKGDSCYVGDKGCIVPPEIASEVQTGDLIFIGKKGLPSTMPNIFYGVWFSYVTATTTGYGDIVPVTNGGQLMGIFLMLFGTFYMAMPLTAAATTFYNVHEKHAQLGTVTPIPAVTSDADSNKENPAASDAAVSEGGATTHIPSFTQPQPHPAPPLSHRPSIRRPSVIGDLMRAQITSAIKELRSFDRLIEEVITDLHSSPICFFDEALMRQEERKYSTNSDTFSALDDVSSIKSGASLSQSQKNNSTPPRQMHRMRRNIAKLCKGLEDVMRGNEAVVIDLLFLHHAILHGELEHTN